MDRMEYVIGMLTHMRILQWSDVQPLLDAFDRMDVDANGRLDRRDLEVAAQKQAELDAAADDVASTSKKPANFSPSTSRRTLFEDGNSVVVSVTNHS